MTFYIPEQTPVILSMLLLGTVFGFVYDLFGVKRCFISQSFRWLFIEDLLLSFFFCLFFILVVFVMNYGMVRWYEFFFCGVGFLLYRLTVGEAVFALLKLAMAGVRRLCAMLVFPVGCLKRGALRLFAKGSERLERLLLKVRRQKFSKKEKKRLLAAAKGGFQTDTGIGMRIKR